MVNVSAIVVVGLAFIDITRYHFKRDVGDLAVIGTWAKLADGQRRRCLVLMMKWAYGTDDLRVATVYDDVDLPNWAVDSRMHGNMEWAVHQAADICETLGITLTPPNINRVIDAVQNHLPDLIMMPPAPPAPSMVIGDIQMRERDSGRVIESEIRVDV